MTLERNVSVRTPESIAFYYELAGLGSRFLAVALDFIIQSLGALAILLLALWAAPGAQSLAASLHIKSATFQAVVISIAVIMLFLLYSGYFIAFETLWNGQTPGKRLIGIRVVRDGGYPVAFMDSAIRNLIRVIESVFAYIPSIVSCLASSQNKRLGDLAAGTIVVRDRAFEVVDPKQWMSGDADFAAEAQPLSGLDRVTDDEYALAQRYVARSHMLEPYAAQQTASRIAAALRSKLGSEAARYSDHELLVRIAAQRRR
jgi:uncharacterized RDD family membrane protein YckC